MGVKPGRWALRDRRWPALRLQALRRDGWKCVQCGSRHRLEVDHVLPVRDHPDRAFDLSNLQVLCATHHTEKTLHDIGRAPNPERQKWLDVVRNT